MRRGGVLALVVAAWLSWPAPAAADAVDDAHARGNEAVASRDWEGAAEAYEEAAALLRAPNPTLSYNLGTTYAHLGRLGLATFHLRQAMAPETSPSAEVVESARANLQEVRQRAELSAASSGAQIDRPATWWDLLLDALRAEWVGFVAVLAGAVLLLALYLDRRRKAFGHPRGVVQAIAGVAALVYVVVGGLHALALRAQSTAPEAIVIGDRVQARARPGAHAPEAVVLQGGARVRVVDQAPGWRQVRLPGGLAGWVPENDVRALGTRGRAGRMATTSQAAR